MAAIDDGQLTVQLADGAELELPTGYADAGHLDHGYALTAHRAQGATVDATFVLGSDDLSREWGYTALSRHRDEAHFYVSAPPEFLNEPAAPLTTPDDVSSAVHEHQPQQAARRRPGRPAPRRAPRAHPGTRRPSRSPPRRHGPGGREHELVPRQRARRAP